MPIIFISLVVIISCLVAYILKLRTDNSVLQVQNKHYVTKINDLTTSLYTEKLSNKPLYKKLNN